MSFRFTVVLAVVCLLLETIRPAEAQVRGSISGTVTDSVSGEVLIAAQVLLFGDTASAPLRSVATNKFGFYSIQNIPPGQFRLVARTLGYLPVTTVCSMTQGRPSLLIDLQLTQTSIGLEEVVVQGDRSAGIDVEMNSVRVQPAIMATVPSLGGESDLIRTMQLLPGVSSESELSSGLYVRGSSPDQNLTLLDGMPILNPAHLGGLLSTFNSDAISDVQLIKGAFPAEYGGRTSSVLDVTMKNGTKERLGGAAGISLLSSRLMLQGPISNNATFMVSARRMYLDLLIPVFADEEKTPTYYFYDLNGKASIALSPDDRLSVNAYGGRDVLRRSTENEDVNFDIHWENTAIGTRWTHIFSPSLFSSTSLTFTNYGFGTRVYSSPSKAYQNYHSSSVIRDLTLRQEFQFSPHEDHNMQFGGEVVEDRYDVSALDIVADQVRASIPESNNNAVDMAAYLQDEWRITNALTANVGVRLNAMQNRMFKDVEPRVALAFKLSDDVTLKGAAAIAHQYMHLVVRNDIAFPTDIWIRSGDGIAPSSTKQASFGFDAYLAGRRYLLTVEAYDKQLKNLYEYRESAELTAGVPTKENFTSGSGEAYGVELFFEKKAGPLTGWIGYTLAWTRRTFAELNSGRTFYPRYDRRHDVSIVASYRASDTWEFGATWTFASGQAYTLPSGLFYYPVNSEGGGRAYLDYPERNSYRLPPFHKLDVSAVHSFSWFGLPFRLSLNVYNLYDRQNPFARYIKYDETPTLFGTDYVPSQKQLTLFPVLPTLGLSCTF
jgi:Carboxypeptidase regulatory-like domain/TonB-dependent Receptor Plug Domain